MSNISMIDRDLAVVYSRLLTVPFQASLNILQQLDFHIIIRPRE